MVNLVLDFAFTLGLGVDFCLGLYVDFYVGFEVDVEANGIVNFIVLLSIITIDYSNSHLHFLIWQEASFHQYSNFPFIY